MPNRRPPREGMRPGDSSRRMSAPTIRLAHFQVSWAVREMASSRLSPRTRLVQAVEAHVDRVFSLLNRPAAFPPEIEVMIVALLARLTASGSYRNTVDGMTDGEVGYTIVQLTNLRDVLARALEPDSDPT